MKNNLQGKDIVVQTTIVMTMMFKIFVLAAVSLTLGTVITNFWINIFILIAGIFWVLGLQNINLLWYLFTEEGK